MMPSSATAAWPHRGTGGVPATGSGRQRRVDRHIGSTIAVRIESPLRARPLPSTIVTAHLDQHRAAIPTQWQQPARNATQRLGYRPERPYPAPAYRQAKQRQAKVKQR